MDGPITGELDAARSPASDTDGPVWPQGGAPQGGRASSLNNRLSVLRDPNGPGWRRGDSRAHRMRGAIRARAETG